MRLCSQRSMITSHTRISTTVLYYSSINAAFEQSNASVNIQGGVCGVSSPLRKRAWCVEPFIFDRGLTIHCVYQRRQQPHAYSSNLKEDDALGRKGRWGGRGTCGSNVLGSVHRDTKCSQNY